MKDFFLKFVSIVYAQTAPTVSDITNLPKSNPAFGNDLSTLILVSARWLSGSIFVLALIAIVYSGVMYITAGQNVDQAGKAKNNLTWAISGIVIAALAFVIVQIIANEINAVK